MADTTALKNRIRAAIKANDNQEITGSVLQQTLLNIVDELDLYPELENEATTRGNADTQLNNLITGVKNNVDNGYVYAGIATPSTTPVSGKVFYIALQAGTYTNFGGTTVTEGVTILKYNGTSWVKEQVLFTDDEPTSGSDNLVKSGGVDKSIQEKTSNYIDKKAIRTDGGVIDNNDTILTDFIDISQFVGMQLVWPCNSMASSDKAMCFYDSNKTLVNWYASSASEIRTTTVNSNYAFMRATLKKGATNNAILINGDIVWELNDAKSLQDIYSKIGNLKKDAAVLNYTQNFYLGSDGLLYYDNTCIASDFVDVRERKSNTVLWKYGTYNSNAKLVMYDSNKTRIDSTSEFSTSGEKSITLADNVAFIRASFAAGNQFVGIKNGEAYIYKPYFGTKEYVSGENNLRNFTPGYGIGVDGTPVEDNDFILSPLIPINGAPIEWWHGDGTDAQDSNFNICFYNSNKKFIDYYPKRSYTPYVYTRTTIPEGSAFVRASFKANSNAPRMIVDNSIYQPLWKCSDDNTVKEYAEKEIDRVSKSLHKSIVPDYYESHLQAKIDAVNLKDASCGNNQDSFVFVTDTHIESNYGHSPALIEKIIRGTGVRKVFHGGDVFHGQATKQLGIKKYKDYLNMMSFCDMYITIGNHDLNIADRMSIEELYGTCIKPIEHLVHSDRKNYYYFDNENQKIRYFFMDMHTPSEDYPREHEVDFTEQLNWLEDKSAEVGSTWNIVVLGHIIFTTPVIEGGVITGAVKSELGEALIAKLDEMYDNASMPTIIGVISGHTHWDWGEYSSKGYPIIATTTDSTFGIDSQGGDVQFDFDNRVPGTISEQAFDVVHIDKTTRKIYMERIGFGSNREFSY